jgi:acetyl esterase/lipase
MALVLLTAASGCTRFTALNALVPSCGYVRTTGIAYGAQPRQTLDVYRPTGNAPPLGIVVFFYGGDWQNGNKADYRFVAQALTSRGFIAVLPDYRLYPQVQFPAFVEDGALAVRWVHDHVNEIGGDPGHVYLMGHSAGAYIAAMLTLDARYLRQVGLDRSTIRAAACLSGPYDFVPSPDDRGAFGMARDDLTPSAQMEPIYFVDGHAPPMLLLQGLKDTTVDPRNAPELAERIRKAGGKARYIVYPHRGHPGVVLALAFPFRWLAPVLRDTVEFFRNH